MCGHLVAGRFETSRDCGGVALLLVVACANDVESRSQPNGGAEDIATNLAVPWGIAFLSDGSALIAERDSAAVKRLASGAVTDAGAVAGVAPRGEGGLLGLATSGLTMFAYITTARTTASSGWGSTEPGSAARRRSSPASPRARATTAGASRSGRTASCMWRPVKPAIPIWHRTIVAGRQDTTHQSDGSIPPDNPDPSSAVWSYGHRNIQGLAWDSAGRLWATEFGADRVDELNLIQPGGNYGWPMAEGRSDGPGLSTP